MTASRLSARLSSSLCSTGNSLRLSTSVRGRLSPGSSRASCFWASGGSLTIGRSNVRVQELGKYGLVGSCRESSRSISSRDGKQEVSAGRGAEDTNPSEPATQPSSTVSKILKKQLRKHENIYNIPNILTVSRLIATPAIGYLIVHNQHLYAFTLFCYAGFSDLLDGWIARKWKLQTVVGSVIDPGADKALMITLVSCLAVNGLLPLSVATLILGRDVSLLGAAIYYRYASLPAPKTFTRYWDFSLPSAEVHPTGVSKFNTFLQLGLIGTTMCVSLLHDPSAMNSVAGGYLQSMQTALGGPDGVRTLVQGMSAVVASTTIYSGLSYAWLKDAVTILGDDEALKKKQGWRGRAIIGTSFGGAIALAAWFAWRDWEGKTGEECEE